MKLLCASYPRSGSQFLVDSLRAAIGDELRWCEGYTEAFDPDAHNMLKTHDFDLRAAPLRHWGAIVQVRNPLDAVPSYFEVQLKYGQPDTYESWREFARTAFVYWAKFVRKWVLNSQTELVIQYRDLAEDPTRYVEHIAWLLTGRTGCEPPAIKMRNGSSHKNFRYYNKSDFRQFIALCAIEMRIMGYEVKL